MASVLRPWVENVSWKAQSVLMSSTRRPDGAEAPKLGQVVRWIRAMTMRDSTPGVGSFMDGDIAPFDKEFEKEISKCNIHAVFHVAHAMEIIGYCAKDDLARQIALQWYLDLCKMLHVKPETKEEMMERLKDGVQSDCWK